MTQNERLLFLTEYLSGENGRYSHIQIPQDVSEQKLLLRSLMNIREPKPVSAQFLAVQDEYLKHEIDAKGITDAAKLKFAEDRICLWQGDITTLKCGAVVNAANSAMLGCFVPCHKCIDNAIHTFSGIELRLECARLMQAQGHEEEIGCAKITRAYNLPCDYILHTVGPAVSGRLTEEHCRLLASCYRECLALAEKNGIRSIAFPCISTGEFRFPGEKAAEIAVAEVRKEIAASSVERVIFNVFTDKDKRIYEKLLG